MNFTKATINQHLFRGKTKRPLHKSLLQKTQITKFLNKFDANHVLQLNICLAMLPRDAFAWTGN